MKGLLLVLFAVVALTATAFAQPNPPVPPTWPFDQYQLKEIGGEWQWVAREESQPLIVEVNHAGSNHHGNRGGDHRNNRGDYDRHSPHYGGPNYYYGSPRPYGYYYEQPPCDELFFDGRHWSYRHSW